MKPRYIGLIVAGLGIALFITLFSPFASSHPDGLERVAEDKGFLEVADSPPYELISDYVFPWVDNEDLATVLSGIVGCSSRRPWFRHLPTDTPAPPRPTPAGAANGGAFPSASAMSRAEAPYTRPMLEPSCRPPWPTYSPSP
jgi:hypothetical protein